MIRTSALVAVLALAACKHPPTTTPPESHPGSGSAAVASSHDPTPAGGSNMLPATPVGTPIIKHPNGKRAMIEAPHAARIRVFAATPDGTAALTADDSDDIRLWPALDGSLEPRVVELPRPKFLALGKDPANPSGFIAAIIDDVGGLVIAKLGADGIVTQRAVLESELAFTGIAMTAKGPLGWRNDQTIVQMDGNGAAVSVLPVEAGEHLVTIAVNGDKALAVVETAADQTTHHHARLLDITGAKLAWGAAAKAKDDISRAVAVSPSGKRFASLMLDAKSGMHLLVFSIDGKGGATLIDNQNDRNAGTIAFTDDDHVALVQEQALQFVEVGKTKSTPGPTVGFEPTIALPPVSFAVAGGKVITPRNDELVIADASLTQYLGYGLQSPNVAAVGGNGRLLVGLGDQFALLDHDLKQVASPDVMVPTGTNIQEVHWMGNDDWLVESTNQNDGKSALALVDLANKQRKELRTNLPVAPIVMFEPTTNIVTLSLGDAPEALKYDPAKRALDKLLALPKPNGFEQRELVPVAPSLAGGNQLISVQMRDTTTLAWSKSATKIDAGPGATATLDGTLAATDRAGHVYVWVNGPDKKLVLAGYDNGKQFGTLATEGPTTVWPDPKGERLVEIASKTLALVKRDGTKLWSIPMTAASEAHWLDDNSIALISALGLARIDAGTGKISATRCGWRFGLSKSPHPFMQRGEPLCVPTPDDN